MRPRRQSNIVTTCRRALYRDDREVWTRLYDARFKRRAPDKDSIHIHCSVEPRYTIDHLMMVRLHSLMR